MGDVVGFELIALGAVAFIIAGTVKGTIGIGLPTTAIGLMTLQFAPRTAIVLTLLPMILANAWQVWRMGDILGALRRYAVFGVTLCVGVGVTTIVAAETSDRTIYATLGAIIVLFAVLNLAVRVPKMPEGLDKPAQVFFGVLAGIMGGMTAVWAPPMAIYLTARQVDKDDFVRASGLLIFLGSLPLVWGYARTEHLTLPLLGVSALMVVPTLAGFALGERLRNAMDQQRFRTVFLWIFFVLGLNLIRRAIFAG